jgi:hypothetical protein
LSQFFSKSKDVDKNIFLSPDYPGNCDQKMPLIKTDNPSTGETSCVKNINFVKNSVFRGHYLATPELGQTPKDNPPTGHHQLQK